MSRLPPEPELDLDLQIHLAERAILARSARLRQNVRALGEETAERLGQGVVVAGAGVTAWMIGRWISRRLSPSRRPPKRSGLFDLVGFLLPLISAEKFGPLPGGLPALLLGGLLPWAEKIVGGLFGHKRKTPATSAPAASQEAEPRQP